VEQLAPIIRVADAKASSEWYGRLGFVVEFEHRFAPELPLYIGIARGAMKIHLSEHLGDARPGTLIYMYVEDVDADAATLGITEIEDNTWGRDFVVADPDGNRLRIGTPWA
jgi:catechol 2,3-dioxygenase-like lactoylglutathione lyase family enzyme